MKNLTTLVSNYQNELVVIDRELKELPAGNLLKRQTAFYHRSGELQVGITKNPELIKKLCRKKYLSERKKQIEKNLKSPIIKLNAKSIHELIDEFPSVYQAVPRNYFHDATLKEWLKKPYQKNPYPRDGLTYYSTNKVEFRTKSEALIASELERYEIPYLYEVAFKIGNKRIYPDFIIKNPYNGRLIVWEHFGALNREGYEKKMNDKMTAFRNSSYESGENLIYTFESDVADATRISKLIEEVILSG